MEEPSIPTDLSSLKDGFWFEVFVVSWILNVSLNPAYILAAPETPFLQALQTQDAHIITDVHQLIEAHV